MSAAPSTLDIVTLIIAVLALAVSCAALTWQIWQYFLQAARVSVELLWGGAGAGSQGPGIVVGPIREGSLDSLRRQGFSDYLFAVRGRNKGRHAVDITDYRVSIDNGFAFSNPAWHLNPDLPKRLEAGSSVTFYAPMDQVLTAVQVSSEVVTESRGKLRGTLDLASGKIVHSEWHMLPPPDAPDLP